MMIELGLDTFGDVMYDGDGRPVTQAQALRNVVAEGVLAEQVGVDAFGVGEHHRPDFSVSAPEVVLAAIAGETERILLGSAVTVLSTDDPIRVFQRFSTLNAVSNGRAEVILGRGSFTESYPLFGYDLSKYNELFEEKLATFVKLLDQQPIVYPPVENGGLRTWVGVGGSPESVVRAARHGLPLTLAVIGGSAKRFLPYVESVQPRVERVRKITAADRGPLSRAYCRDRRAGEGRSVAALSGHDEPNRPRARMAAARTRRLRARSRTRWRTLCRCPRHRGGENRPHGDRISASRASISNTAVERCPTRP